MVFGSLLKVADDHAMVLFTFGLVFIGDSHMISVDLLSTNCGPPVIRPVLRLVADQIGCDCNFLYGPMVADGLWWSATILVVGGLQPVVPSV